MNPVTRPRRLTLVVLAVYLAVNSLGTLLHEYVHAHSATDACCHAHECSSQPAESDSSPALIASVAHDHDCVVCRVTGQPVVTAVVAIVEFSASVTPDPLPCPSAAPRSLAVRLSQSRAPPAAAI